VREAVPSHVPVSVKMRRGIDDTQKSRDNFFTILDGAFERGVDAITVHGRTVNQRYIGPSRWGFLKEVKQYVGNRTILGSGDLFTPQSCLDMIRQTGVDGVTAARGAIGNPWIFAQTRALFNGEPLPDAPSTHEQRRVIMEHFELAADLYGLTVSLPLMRKFCIKYAKMHPQGLAVRDAFIKARNQDHVLHVFDTYYSEDLPGHHPTSDEVDEVGEDCG
jgi:tRNA-dihydrouridine synthase